MPISGLFGGYDHNIDKKGRLAIPAKLREKLGESFVICQGIYGKLCLCAYSNEEWDKLVEKLSALPAGKSGDLMRFLYDGTYAVEPDSQGRILIPAGLREYANLDEEVHIIGMGHKLEIWNAELWRNEKTNYTTQNIGAVSFGLEL